MEAATPTLARFVVAGPYLFRTDDLLRAKWTPPVSSAAGEQPGRLSLAFRGEVHTTIEGERAWQVWEVLRRLDGLPVGETPAPAQ